MKVGDLIDMENQKNGKFPGLVLKIWEFNEYCDKMDDLELEYDIDDAWNNWQASGPLVDVLNPLTEDITKIWIGGSRV